MVELLVMLAVLAGAMMIGFALITRVPQLLHTPLMSLTNAISAVTILGALLVFSVSPGALASVAGGLALVTAGFNLFGGFAVTGRMVAFFKKAERP